jgi:hypothetical protein
MDDEQIEICQECECDMSKVISLENGEISADWVCLRHLKLYDVDFTIRSRSFT